MLVCSCCGSKDFVNAIENPIDYEYGLINEQTLSYRQCLSCDTEWLVPRPDEDAIKSFYPEDYHAYHENHDLIASTLVNLRAVIRRRYYSKLTPDYAQVRLFDVGSGDCRHFHELQKTGRYICSGIEINEDMVRVGREQGFEIFSGTLENLEVDNQENKYDIITMYHVLEHVEEPDIVMEHVFRMLRPGGFVIGQLPVKDSWEHKIFEDKWAGYHYPRHLQIFSRNGLKALFENAGFTKILFKSTPHCQTAISIQNKLMSMGIRLSLRGGRSSIYPVLLALSLPFELLVTLIDKGGTMDFTCQKSNNGER